MEKQIHHAAVLSHGAWGSRKFRSIHFTTKISPGSVNHPNSVNKEIHEHPKVKAALSQGWRIEHMVGGEHHDQVKASHNSALQNKKRLDLSMGQTKRS